MITTTNLEETLQALGFQKNGEIYAKTYPSFSCTMQVDLSSRKLIFPAAIRGRERNDGFDHAENFVVFECVDRLLEKGYRPKHLVLEKAWRFGHDPLHDVAVDHEGRDDVGKALVDHEIPRVGEHRLVQAGDIACSRSSTPSRR